MARLLLALVLVAAVIVVSLNRSLLDVSTLEQITNSLGLWAPIGHVVMFAIRAVLFAPGSVFGLALDFQAVRGAVYYPPCNRCAQWLSRFDRRLSRLTNFGAAFIALAARKPLLAAEVRS